MSQTVVVLGPKIKVARTTADLTRFTRGYAASRRAYDQRRRRFALDDAGKQFKAIVQHDPCAGCGRVGGDTAADHITPLEHGGHNEWQNLTGLCRACNASKKSKPLLHWLAERRRR